MGSADATIEHKDELCQKKEGKKNEQVNFGKVLYKHEVTISHGNPLHEGSFLKKFGFKSTPTSHMVSNRPGVITAFKSNELHPPA